MVFDAGFSKRDIRYVKALGNMGYGFFPDQFVKL